MKPGSAASWGTWGTAAGRAEPEEGLLHDWNATGEGRGGEGRRRKGWVEGRREEYVQQFVSYR